MRTDYHCHVLPGIDDGSKDTEMSLQMISLMKEQGIERIIATPHFYAHRERSLERFLEKRKIAYDKLMSANPAVTDIHLGAEISIEKGISEIKGIEQLAMEGSNLILFEFPYTGFSEWMIEEAENIAAEYKLQIVVAHIHRYKNLYRNEEIERILGMDAIFQINNEAFRSWGEKKMVKNLVLDGKRIIFGSDSHNMESRKPDFDLLDKKLKKLPDIISQSDSTFDKYIK